MRIHFHEFHRTLRALLLIAVLGSVLIGSTGHPTVTGIASVARGLELPLRDLSAWLLASAPGGPRRQIVTIGLRN